MESENELSPTGIGGKVMDKVPAYGQVHSSYGTVFPYPVQDKPMQKVAQDSLPNHRNSHRR